MTRQIPETLILDGDNHSMSRRPTIGKHQRIIEAENPSSLDFSTACHRRYVGTWEIKMAKLYLIKIWGIYEMIGDEPLFADWFSGVLSVPSGPMLKFGWTECYPTYGSEWLIGVSNGIVVKQHEVVLNDCYGLSNQNNIKENGIYDEVSI